MPLGPNDVVLTPRQSIMDDIDICVDGVLNNTPFMLAERQMDTATKLYYWDIMLPRDANIIERRAAAKIYEEAGWDKVVDIMIPGRGNDPDIYKIRLMSKNGFF